MRRPRGVGRLRASFALAHGAVSVAAGWLGALALMAAPAQAGGGKVDFNRDIRPILSENCYYCHGPDPKHREADLRLDDRDVALEHEAIVPGKPDESLLVERIDSEDPFERMPPKQANKTLTAAQKDLLRRWIEQGAAYAPHWAYITPRRPAVPTVSNEEWVRNPVDAFILARLEAEGIAPSPEADRRTLIRRLSLDLIGLPPTPEEVAAFVEDDDPRAYEHLVDRLLASPHYGERMAVPWLDLVRFSDTVGYHGDQNQRIFPYRDYVIDAFNSNKPFDRFTAEQLAGDLLPDATDETRVASGFNRLNMMTREGGAQPKEYLAKYAADRVRTVATTWLGSTMGCAECHDHKFDPFTARDFYSLGAFFADVTQWGVYADYGYTPNPDLRGFNNDYPFPPEIRVPSRYLMHRKEQFQERIDRTLADASARLAEDEELSRAFEHWAATVGEFLKEHPDGWVTPPADAPEDAEPRDDGSFAITGKAKKGDTERFRLTPGPGPVAAIRLEVLPDEIHGGKIGRNPGASPLVSLSAAVEPAGGGKARPVAFAEADAAQKDERYAGGTERIGVLGGWKTSSARLKSPQSAVWVLDAPVTLAEGEALVVTLKSADVGRVRLSLSPLAPADPRQEAPPAPLAAALSADPDDRTSEQADRLRAAYLLGTGVDAEALRAVRALRREVLECRDGMAYSMVTEAREPMVARVLPRGNWLDESGAVVEPSVPGFLPGAPSADGRLTRLDLARWLAAPENPLTARVFANRLWKQCFGTALSAVVDDLGAQGEPPSHPELLDWLAVEFRESGWDVKHLVKLLVMSATYRQDAHLRPELQERDPGNRLLASQTPRRLEAEFVRDNALTIAGLINLEVGGPSAFPYQPAGYYANLQFPDRDYVADTDARQYRRGVYMHWQRTFLHPMLANFDAPSREECTAMRTVANTPQQALTLLNDPTFVEAARVLAARILAEPAASDAERLGRLYDRVLARPARPAEAGSLLRFLESQRAVYGSNPEDARKLLGVGLAPAPDGLDPIEAAAWANVCRVVLNLHESITRY